MGDEAGRFGLKIAVETLFVESENEYTPDPARLAAEIRAIAHPQITGTLDVSHSYLMSSFRGGTLADAVDAFAPVTGHFHLHGPIDSGARRVGSTASIRTGAAGLRHRRPAPAVRLGRHSVRVAAAGAARCSAAAYSRSSCRNATGASSTLRRVRAEADGAYEPLRLIALRWRFVNLSLACRTPSTAAARRATVAASISGRRFLPRTFLEWGVAVPFTTPLLGSGRVRPAGAAGPR